MSLVTALAALGIAAGLVGTVTVVLPGLAVVWASVFVWALFEENPYRWTVLVVATVLLVAATVLKYAVPGRRLIEAGVPQRTLLVAGFAGIVGFFAIPVVGLFVGFVGGVLAMETARLGSVGDGWPATVLALRAVGLSILVELGAGLLILASFIAALIAA
jgi:uncharacterized protein YqgC (DUF456 family)